MRDAAHFIQTTPYFGIDIYFPEYSMLLLIASTDRQVKYATMNSQKIITVMRKPLLFGIGI